MYWGYYIVIIRVFESVSLKFQSFIVAILAICESKHTSMQQMKFIV